VSGQPRICRSAPCARCFALGACKSEERSIAFGDRVTFLLRGQEKSNQKRRPPRLALVGHPAQQVREPGPGFSNGHPARAKRSRHPCRLPLRGLSSPTHRRTGAPVEQRAILARTLQKSREQRHGTARGLSCSFTRASVAEPIAGRLLTPPEAAIDLTQSLHAFWGCFSLRSRLGGRSRRCKCIQLHFLRQHAHWSIRHCLH